MAMRGERFELDFNSDDEISPDHDFQASSSQNPASTFIKDVLERDSNEAAPPTAPKLKSTTTGFPEHRKRSKFSRFKQQDHSHNGSSQKNATLPRIGASEASQSEPSRNGFNSEEMDRIDRENKDKLQNMSEDEIAQEKRELLSGLSSSLVERLLKRSNIDDGREDIREPFSTSQDTDKSKTSGASKPSIPAQTSTKRVSFADPDLPPNSHNPTNEASLTPSSLHDPDAPPLTPPPDLYSPTEKTTSSSQQQPPPDLPNIHFPAPPLPSLDPSSPSFLTDLHTKYFPHLPSNPDKLAWMAPLSTTSPSPHYDPQTISLPPSSLRFDFAGNLLPPRLSHQLPTNLGLHHHGHAPEAAGYTIPELAILGRSTVPAQKCVSFQTVGRILYKLGIGVFGDFEAEEGDGGGELCRGLWGCVEREHVIDVLLAEVEREEGRGNRSVRALAMEAVWLWRKGGGRRPGETEEEGGGEVRTAA